MPRRTCASWRAWKKVVQWSELSVNPCLQQMKKEENLMLWLFVQDAAALRMIIKIWTSSFTLLRSESWIQTSNSGNSKEQKKKKSYNSIFFQVPPQICPVAKHFFLSVVILSFLSTHKLNLNAIWEAPGFSGPLLGSILVMCWMEGCLPLHGCRRDMIDSRPNRRPSQVSPGCPGHPQFKVHSAQTVEEDTAPADWEAI